MALYLAIFAFLLVGANAVEIPSYMHICGRRDPKLDECIANSVLSIRPQLIKGIPDFDIPSVEPLKFDKLDIIEMNNLKATLSDVKIYGVPNFQIKSLHLDLNSQQFDLIASFPKIEIHALYDINANILVPVNGKGPIKITAIVESAKVTMKYKLIEKNGHMYMFFTSMTTKLNIADYSSVFDRTDSFNPTLLTAINQALGSSREEFLVTITPMIEKVVSETVLSLSNKIAKRFPYEQILPDRA